MKYLLSILCCCALLPSAYAQGSNGFTNMLRSLTGAVGGEPKPPPTTQATAVLGVRGMDDDTALASNATPDETQYLKQLDAWAVGRTEAEKAAAKRGLAARKVAYASTGREGK
jgi:hypothetical protein